MRPAEFHSLSAKKRMTENISRPSVKATTPLAPLKRLSPVDLLAASLKNRKKIGHRPSCVRFSLIPAAFADPRIIPLLHILFHRKPLGQVIAKQFGAGMAVAGGIMMVQLDPQQFAQGVQLVVGCVWNTLAPQTNCTDIRIRLSADAIATEQFR